jgi:hypothetical protein
VPELALDQREGDAFVEQLDGMGVTELVRSEPSPHPGVTRDPAQLDPDRAG